MIPLLLAEDNEELRERSKRNLENYGFEVTAVDHGRKLLSVARHLQFKVILADTDLPFMDGDRAIDELLQDKTYEGVFVVGMSAEIDYLEHWINIAHETIRKTDELNLGRVVMGYYLKFCNGKDGRYKEYAKK